MAANGSGGEDGAEVQDFLQRIRELGDKRDREDEERTRKLEEEIVQGRRERQARRAGFDPMTHTISDEPAPHSTLSRPSPSAAIGPSRGSTLSWQRRPDAQGSSGSRNLPLSGEMTEQHSPIASETSPTDDEEPSKNQIAQALGSKDPSWFKQTADRGAGSPAYRRDQVESGSNAAAGEERLRLPGMSRVSASEPPRDISPPPGGPRSLSPSRDGSLRSTARSARESTASRLEGRSPLPVSSSQRLDPSPTDAASSTAESQAQSDATRPLHMSPSQGRMSPERSPSPTKGLGGFVQSAMLRRSDSVNKRWSAQSNPRLGRTDSVSSINAGGGGSGAGLSSLAGPVSPSRREPPEYRRPSTPESNGPRSNGGLARPAITTHSRSQSIVSGEGDGGDAKATPPASPVKTFEQKRWSPTKASWLESALSKGPESPKPKAAAPQQPSWMAEINRAKKERASVDLGKGGARNEIKTGGLLRAPPPGGLAKPLSIGGLPPGFSSGTVKKGRSESESSQEMPGKATSPPAKPKPTSLSPHAASTSSRGLGSAEPPPEENVLQENRPLKSSSSLDGRQQTPPVSKPKPDTPPKDFRSTLKPRQETGNDKGNEEPEFKNVFGRLKRTTTQNYVAPDELKNNILRGKAGLSITGGPKKSERRDDFKDSLIKQKEAMKLKAEQEGPSATSRPAGGASASATPEAIAKKNTLARSSVSPSTDKGWDASTPEALALQQRLKDKAKPNPPGKLSGAPSGSQREQAAGGKLASRFNPGLAGLIARGPPSRSSTAGSDAASGSDSPSAPHDRAAPRDAADGHAAGQLTHMTKARARGPKRRVPGSKEQVSAGGESRDHRLPGPMRSHAAKNFKPQSATPDETSAPGTASEGVEPEVKTINDTSKPAIQATQPMLQDDPEDDPSINVKEASAQWAHSLDGASSESKRVNSPIKLPTRADEEKALEEAGLRSPARVEDRGHQSPKAVQPNFAQRSSASPPKSPLRSAILSSKSDQKSPFRPGLDAGKGTAGRAEMEKAPISYATDAHRIFAELFDKADKRYSRADIDTQAILASKPTEAGRINTLQKQISHLGGDGKMRPVPPHREHILFEDELYLCYHVFEAGGTKSTEVYLWAGDNASESAIEDAQLFARKFARDNNGRLLTLKQGREPANLFHALGGIIITRRGSSSRADSPASYMLCCRRHLGQIAFDEVDLSVHSLCSASPYVVSTSSGKVFLWRGRGSGIDELSSARLIGMDLGMMGGIEEIEEGKETPAFLNILGAGPGTAVPRYAEHWKMKPSYEQYSTRLFRVEHGSKAKVRSFWSRPAGASHSPAAQILELYPFCQADLDPEHVYCVDAFFDFYIILGAKAQQKCGELQTALMFAQEYGILAASLEDRPFVPVGTVVLQGVPRDLKAVFRKWDDRRVIVAEGSGSGQLRVLSLSDAIEASRN
ncbi:MAG: hypothetical protein M1832_001070 [Thelocarpon impressellum]|nr:MAG: hypothetical protein M1832_001070 [Thelocarpon impressellum]